MALGVLVEASCEDRDLRWSVDQANQRTIYLDTGIVEVDGGIERASKEGVE